MDREKDYRYGWLDSLYLHSGFDTAHSGHGKVEDNEVRSARLCKFNGFPACFRLFAQIVIRFALEQLAQHLPHAGVVNPLRERFSPWEEQWSKSTRKSQPQ